MLGLPHRFLLFLLHVVHGRCVCARLLLLFVRICVSCVHLMPRVVFSLLLSDVVTGGGTMHGSQREGGDRGRGGDSGNGRRRDDIHGRRKRHGGGGGEGRR